MAAEFLPLCDVLFNVISLAGYFCDVVFDLVLGYALFNRGRFGSFVTVMGLVGFSLIISQCVSLRWYLNQNKTSSISSLEKKKHLTSHLPLPNPTTYSRPSTSPTSKFSRLAVIILHCTQMGVLWRYAKLFVPVDLRHVKHEVRDLCMLRLVHAFCEAAPMLLFQLQILVSIENESQELNLKSLGEGSTTTGLTTNFIQQSTVNQEYQERTFKDLNIVSAVLSLFSVCWALASFSKNVRLQNVHRLVLTWLGVIFQFFWRLGTVTSRVISLTVYASFYGQWVFLVIILHWFSMFLWLISPKNVFHGERISRVRKSFLGGLIAFVYVFAYINLQEVNHRQKMITFYVVMFLENCLLVCLWLVGVWKIRPEQWSLVPLLVLSTFALGMGFMVLYYRYFHVRRLGYEAGGRVPGLENAGGKGSEYQNSHLNMRTCISNIGGSFEEDSKYTHVIPGVFNCRFSNPANGATKRKKKKPTTFIPPPVLGGGLTTPTQYAEHQLPEGPMSIPFWRRPLPRSHAGSSETESNSVESRINIHQKLQEKKQKQLAELKIIEEEIKQGKLGGPAMGTLSSGDDDKVSLPRQPIPRSKKHIDLEPIDWHSGSIVGDGVDGNSLGFCIANMDDKYNNCNYGLNMGMQDNSNRNMSPISSQISATESHRDSSLTKQVHPRSKMPHNLSRTPFVRPNIYPGGLYLEINHPRQISGTYSSSVENNEHLPFPYNVIPPPRSKLDSRLTPTLINQQNNLNASNNRNIQRAKTPEILLAPHYLENSRMYCDWMTKDPGMYDRNQTVSSGDENLDVSAADESILGFGQNPHRIPSDIDSQVSLPRSYTLPREFKYYRRNKVRKVIKNEHFIASTNSSDGDVDSCDDNESEHLSNISNQNSTNSQNYHQRQPHSQQQPQQQQQNFHNHPNNFNIAPNPGTSATFRQGLSPSHHHQIHHQKTHSNSSTSNMEAADNFPSSTTASKAVNNLDLISGVDSTVMNQNRMRMRVYGAGKTGAGMVRHETKL